jgi:hypothetical protein
MELGSTLQQQVGKGAVKYHITSPRASLRASSAVVQIKTIAEISYDNSFVSPHINFYTTHTVQNYITIKPEFTIIYSTH